MLDSVGTGCGRGEHSCLSKQTKIPVSSGQLWLFFNANFKQPDWHSRVKICSAEFQKIAYPNLPKFCWSLHLLLNVLVFSICREKKE